MRPREKPPEKLNRMTYRYDISQLNTQARSSACTKISLSESDNVRPGGQSRRVESFPLEYADHIGQVLLIYQRRTSPVKVLWFLNRILAPGEIQLFYL